MKIIVAAVGTVELYTVRLLKECCAQVSLDEAAVARVTSEEGTVAKADFIKLSQDLKLLDFGGPMGQEKRKLATPRRERRVGETDEEGNVNINQLSLL